MAAPNLAATVNVAEAQIAKLQKYRIEASCLDAKYQHIISEMIMLRLFSVFEDAVAEIAFKIVAGAIYTNGKIPAVSIKARRFSESRALLLTYGRSKPESNLKWTKAQYIKQSVEYIISVNESYIVNAQAHGQIIDEMRRVRNFLAHNTKTAKADFKVIVRQTYGANVSISVGAFLTSTRRSNISNIEKYMTASKAIISSLARGQ
ncbi:hypothetical protein [Acidovorax radicis]|uniref:hypothetical protein n=1 Tax=Acidovorax radicis TaxID=758826 RepID=UPI001111DA7F|nr:hypothetical protein [Acidovorax radicis]